MWAGVSKSGSPRSRWSTVAPDCSRARAAAITRPSSEVMRRTGRSAISLGIGNPPPRVGSDGSSQCSTGHRSRHGPPRHAACVSPWASFPTPPRGYRTMSKFDLRDISQRLSASRDTEALVNEFLGYLESVRPDWHASLAFYEISQDALVSVYQRASRRLARKDLRLPVDQLPSRLVRKFFHPSAFFNQGNRRSLLSHLLQTSPHYEVPQVEAQALRAVSPLPHWESCVCLPLADQEELLGMLVLASEHRNAFGSRAIGEILPIR